MEASRRKTIIAPPGGIVDLQLYQLWIYRDLIRMFIYRDFIAQYKQTFLGPLWYVLQPLAVTMIYFIVFNRIARLPTDGIPPFIFYLSGIIVWQYFSDVLLGTSGTFLRNFNLFGKVYFPRLAVPISIMLSRLIGFFVQLLILGVFLLIYSTSIHLSITLVLFPLLIVLMAALGLGLGLIVSALTTRYRDLQVVVTFGMQLLMFATPVIYPLSLIPEAYQHYMLLNPIAPIIETLRWVLFGVGELKLMYLAYSMFMTFGILLVGALLFTRVERTFMDTV